MAYENVDLSKYSILLYDGDCNFCSNSVQFIIKRDKTGHFKFASLQSKTGEMLIASNAGGNIPDSLVLYDTKGIHFKSRAALRVCIHLNHIWKIFSLFLIIPAFILDPLYDFIAKNRHKIIKNSCSLASKEFNDRFLS